jgi:hypothetical protein
MEMKQERLVSDLLPAPNMRAQGTCAKSSLRFMMILPDHQVRGKAKEHLVLPALQLLHQLLLDAFVFQ